MHLSTQRPSSTGHFIFKKPVLLNEMWRYSNKGRMTAFDTPSLCFSSLGMQGQQLLSPPRGSACTQGRDWHGQQQFPLPEWDAGCREPGLDAAQAAATLVHARACPALPTVHLCHLPALSQCRFGQPVAPEHSHAPPGSRVPTTAEGTAGLSPQQAEDRQGMCHCQLLPRVTEASKPWEDVRYHFIMTKATSHIIFKVHYYSPSTNHRHKPGIVQIWPRWRGR